MKKTVILATLLLLLTATVHGVYDPNGTHNTSDDGKMRIMSSSSGASASAGVSESGSGAASEQNGTLWEAELAMTNRSATLSDDSIHNVSIHDGEGTYRIEFTGYIQTPTPCHIVDHHIEETAEDEYTFTVSVSRANPDQMCAQVMNTVTYDASFETYRPVTLHIQYGDNVVKTLEPPQEAEDPTSPTNPNKQSVFTGLWNWLKNLF